MTALHTALIVAAGKGIRAGGGAPKQYQPLGGRPLVIWSLKAFLGHPAIGHVLVAIAPEDEALYLAAADAVGPSAKLLPPVEGGATRQASVLAGLEALAAVGPATVLIHDAARPFVSADLIGRVLGALDGSPGVLPVIPVADTLKRGKAGGAVEATVPRDGLWRAQTPQGFAFDAILAAHRRFADRAFTDDAAIAEAADLAVRLVEGDARNLKITEPEDFALAEALMQMNRPSEITVTGQGFDVHRLIPGDGVWLCGVKIPGPYALLGHSDADCGLHAITDAVLGAIGAGDIGTHFPPSDERWKGAASDQFLIRTLELARAAGGRLVHVDVTIICERPKISPHREAMRARLAEITGLPAARVSVKATTTEELGFTGRREGIAAQAVATVAIPG